MAIVGKGLLISKHDIDHLLLTRFTSLTCRFKVHIICFCIT